MPAPCHPSRSPSSSKLPSVSAEGALVKAQQYVLPLKKNPLGPKEALAQDRLTCLHRSAAGFLVTAESHTPHVSTQRS